MIWASLTATAVGHRQPRKRRQHKYRASTNAGVCPLCVNDVLLANLGTRGVVRPSSRCGYRRRVLLWHELGCASGADGAVRRRLPVAAFVPASERTALVVSWGSEHVADWPRGFRSGRRLFLKGPRARRQGALVGRPLGTGMVWTVLSVGFDPFQAPTAASWCR